MTPEQFFLSGYDNAYNDSPYDQGYLDALCMPDQWNYWNEVEKDGIKRAKEILIKKLGE